MKKLITVLMLISQLGFTQSREKQAEDFLLRQMKTQKIPGLQVAVVEKGKIVFSKSYGTANIPDNIPVDNQSIFAINSCTKSFTGVAIMQLVEEGKLDLMAPISKYIDSLPAQWQPIKIQQLLTHISGLPDILRIQENTGAGAFNEAKSWQKIIAMPMDFPTGDQFSYNQTNYVLLGKVITQLRGKHFTQVFQEKQFDVVGMSHTVFGDSRDIIPHYAPTYTFKKAIDGELLPAEKLTANYSEFPRSRRTGSGLNSTAEDMAHWVIALQEGKLLKKETLKTMWSPITFNNGKPTNWALGWGVNKFRAKHRAVGMSGGGRSAFLVYPDDDMAVIVLTNLGGSSPENWIEELAGYFNPEIPAADPITLLRTELDKRGYDKAMQVVEEARRKDPSFTPDENELNEWAYRVMSKDKNKEALELFKLNVALYPDSWNVYDSLGEVLLKSGNKEEAIKMYQKSVELNPNNKGGKQVLSKLK
ncbi:serine hydrolase domain-containing protein [Emticicia agri]|uniref:Serine hydrolase n=1 Tax=Emticicia agri TaxID=2492393 RepID=A0A4Q5LTR0_9BACT|nr:serine hydrolase domain-containing protein [Emticicia agri]RYU93018.1 serine hydrolase [Emticicia agri]